jgi:exopolysaccharide biosynthesis polyprenyl glycosylphosphotransferase
VSIHENFAEPIVSKMPAMPAHDALTGVFSVAEDAFAPSNVNAPAATDHAIYISLKRAMDLAVATTALVLLAPVMALIAVLIKLDSKGPSLFRQTRLGLDGRPFAIFKFRTMTVMEDGEYIRQASLDDDRITRIGRFLRASSIDELPQLLNVISGEMSVIGPRPHARAHDEMYAQLIDCYTLRQNMKPGITGWAQVHGLRGETPTVESMRARVDYDLWYVNNANVALDIEILLRTVLEVFRRRNAF